MAEFTKPKSGTIREQLKKEMQERKRSILHLIFNYLEENNLFNTAQTLKNEAQLSNQYTVCDNVDLEIILQEYNSYYMAKFQREAKILRKVDEEIIGNKKPQSAAGQRKIPKKKVEKIEPVQDEEFQFEIIPMFQNDNKNVKNLIDSYGSNCGINKPLSEFEGYTPEWREIAELIIKEFITKNLDVKWEDCIGLDAQIELLKEATVYPLLYPDLFSSITSSWSGILLYGPPGTGKTLLAKALATEQTRNFINVTCSAFISKWRGDSEKMIKVLFDLAKYYAPSTIFIDEIDSLLSETKDSNHEATCRFKNELLVQMDGLISSNTSIFLLATTNTPWKLDKALLRRFEKRIMIPLPNDDAKILMLKYYLKWTGDNKFDMKPMVPLMTNFSGSEIKIACKELEMRLIREQLQEIKKNKKRVNSKRSPTLQDLKCALESVRPIVNLDYYKQIIDWNEQYGSM